MHLLIFALLVLMTVVSIAQSFSVSTAKNLNAAPSDPDSAELLVLLQQRKEDHKDHIDALVSSLISKKTTFDPATSIDGPLFATCHIMGKTPLWEKLGAARKTNIKGQKYTVNPNEENRVVNYSEIFGKAINLQATGTFVESDSNPPARGGLKTCPYDYSVTVTGASINVFDKSIQLPITGLGCARVLYADPCLRIFISPNDTEVLSGGGDWESAGLITVQVRVDLIDPTWDDNALVAG